MRSPSDIERVVGTHADAVWRVCALYFPSEADRQDAFQETFVAYACAESTVFADGEYEKAWLLRVAANKCKDMLRAASRRGLSLDQADNAMALTCGNSEEQPGSETFMIMEAMRGLDDPPRTPLYLSLVEGYTAREIAALVDAPANTVSSWITRSRALLKEALS